jgi:hypothetical protein
MDTFINFAHDIRDRTSPDSVIMIPYATMLPVYYSERHCIRAIQDDATVSKVVVQLPALFPKSPIYFAYHPDRTDLSKISKTIQKYELVGQTPHLRLLRVLAVRQASSLDRELHRGPPRGAIGPAS